MKKNIVFLFLFTVFMTNADKPNFVTQNPNEQDTTIIPISEISRFVNVYQLIRNRYVESVAPKNLIDNAIKGMLSELDPYSQYIPAYKIDSFNKKTKGSFVGIGITADIAKKKLIIRSVFKDSPSEEAGLKSNDVIIEVDGTPVTPQNLHSSLDAIKGKSGTIIRLTIDRLNHKSFEATLKRAPITIPSVVSSFIPNTKLLHLKINQFTTNTGDEALLAIKQAKNADSIILDLRDNPGGTISSALEVADLFLTEGLIVSTKERNTGKLKKRHATKQPTDNTQPLIVMINKNSASASELLAGALQDQKRSLTIGQKSYGKGSVQTIFPAEDNSAIKLTVSRYYTPNGRAIQAKGITPDIILTPLSAKPKLESPEDYYEAELSNHIPGEGEPDTEIRPLESNINIASQDLELYEAVNIMKALKIGKNL